MTYQRHRNGSPPRPIRSSLMRWQHVALCVEGLGVVVRDLASDVPRDHTVRHLLHLLESSTDGSAAFLVVDDSDGPSIIGRERIPAKTRDALRSLVHSPTATDDGVVAPATTVRDIGSFPIVGSRQQLLGVCALIPEPTNLDPVDQAAQLEILRLISVVVERHHVRRGRLDAIAHERERIAGELHDDSVQAITAISLGLQRLSYSIADQAPEIADSVRSLRTQADDAIDRLRHMMFTLHPPTLELDGLAVTLESYLEAFVESKELTCTVNGDVPGGVSPGIRELAFRLARGAVQNAVKHAGASVITVTLTGEDDVVVAGRDDGTGFDSSSWRTPAIGHAGIAYAHDLAAELGGTYKIDSAVGEGTVVIIRLPRR